MNMPQTWDAGMMPFLAPDTTLITASTEKLITAFSRRERRTVKMASR
jgi:hypothetical protein